MPRPFPRWRVEMTGKVFVASLLKTTSVIALLVSGSNALIPLSADATPLSSVKHIGAEAADNQPMMLEADELTYNIDQDVITAQGHVEIYYEAYTVTARKVVYDRKSAQFSAHGHVRMTEPNGNLIEADNLQLSDDFAQGFIEAVTVYTPQFTKMIAKRATREANQDIILDQGEYTAYTKKKPLWKIKATKIIHREKEKTITFQGASVEFLGIPIALFPDFTMPDPTVKRQSGFLTPKYVHTDRAGYGAAVPYYWALDPSYDLTATLIPLTKQGAFGKVEWRQKLASGSYQATLGGIHQFNPQEYNGSSGNVDNRFMLNSSGSFSIASGWTLGWDGTYKSDRAVVNDYSFAQLGTASDKSEVYLTGINDKNRFDARIMGFQLSQEDRPWSGNPNNPSAEFSPLNDELQSKQPIIHPVIDNSIIFDQSVMGGELSFDGNLTSLTRSTTDALSINGINRFRGVEGTFTRLSANLNWRRTYIDSIGQVFTPFAYAKTNLYFLGTVDHNIPDLTGDAVVFRGMPAVGLEYRYPMLASFKGGNQVIEPIAQLIARPNEAHIGELPNEDAQSIVFDASTLFNWDKFSGFDRNEGGVRANLGLQYRLQFDQGSFVSALFGRSYQLAGQNSYATPDILFATGDSGLETSGSDYVGSLYIDTNSGFRLGANARFDESGFDLQRTEVNASGRFGPLTSSIGYAFLKARPDAGVPDDREEVLGSSALRLADSWRLYGSARYDLQNKNFVQDTVGLGYDDEGFSMSVSYSEDRSRNDGEAVNQIYFFRFNFRTIGGTDFSSSVGK
ncbi:LPS-assembly protein LptD [Polycladidibacter stylochi]|uniref:LPS-assembly protein LptD n=1 Tax=Polycladidibacter stylochi TaxID=1807766 RepID=UPI00082BF1F3|nr:LPS-assembly protein LptD [Pseudovibrio stylochi]